MKNLNFYFLLLACIIGGTPIWSQQRAAKVIQVSGYVVEKDSLTPVMFCTIGLKNTPWGTMSNEKGFFSLPAKVGDTLLFASIGFTTASFVVPDPGNFFSHSYIQSLEKDPVQLQEVLIYPWRDEESLRQALLNLNLPDEQTEIAARNLNPRMMMLLASETGMDGNEVYRYQMGQLKQAYYTKGQFKRMRIFEPSAWMDFIKAWKRGDFSK